MILQSDNGKEFVAEVISHICDIFNIKIKHGRPRRPTSTSMVRQRQQKSVLKYSKSVFEIQKICIKIHLFKVQILKNAEFHLWQLNDTFNSQ